MVLIQELSTELTTDQCCLLSYSLGGDGFPIVQCGICAKLDALKPVVIAVGRA